MVAPSGRGKTGAILDFVKHREFFPPDLEGVVWMNFTGVEPSAKGFEIFDTDPFYTTVDGNEAKELLDDIPETFKKRILVLDDCLTTSVKKEVRETLETQIKRNANHNDLIMFVMTQASFTDKLPSDFREQFNEFYWVEDVGELQKGETLIKRVIKSETPMIDSRIIRNFIDRRGYLPNVEDSPTMIRLTKRSGYKRELWAWNHKHYPQGVYYHENSHENYLIQPLDS